MTRRLAPSLVLLVLALAGPSVAQTRGPTLLFGGDVIFDEPIDYALDQMGRSRDDASSYAALFEELDLDAADVTIVNLETPIADRVRARGDGYDVPVFAAPPAFLEALAHAGVDAVTLANNHAYDQGVAGLAATMENAYALALTTIGAGSDRAAAFRARVFDVEGRRIAIVSATEGVNLGVRSGEHSSPRVALLDETLLQGAIASARSRSDLTIAILHWTETGAHEAMPSHEMRFWCEVAAEAGADLIVGHGPHVPGPRAVMRTSDGRDVVVLYSLGNLVAAMQADEDEIQAPRLSVRDALLASVRTRPAEGGRLAIASVEPRAFYIAASSRALSGEARSRFVRPLALDEEIARADRAACGDDCIAMRTAYEARRARITSLFATARVDPR